MTSFNFFLNTEVYGVCVVEKSRRKMMMSNIVIILSIGNLTCSTSSANYRSWSLPFDSYISGDCTSLAWYIRGHPERLSNSQNLLSQRICSVNQTRFAAYRTEFELQSCSHGMSNCMDVTIHACCFGKFKYTSSSNYVNVNRTELSDGQSAIRAATTPDQTVNMHASDSNI